MATRREFLAGASALCLTAGASRALPDGPCLISAAHIGTRDGGALWSDGHLTPFDLPVRGHAPVRLTEGRVLMMARRPGLFATILDPRAPGAPPQTFAPSGNRRFAGHACVSPDGRELMTSEFDATTFEGALVSRDPKTGTERARWPLGGIEPHEVVFARDGSHVVVALGGLIRDGGVAGPAFNPDGVDSAVLEVDPSTGRVLARRKLAQASLSLRHLATDGKTTIVAAQDQDISLTRPLLAKVGSVLEPLAWPDPRECDFRSYIGSVAIDCSGAFIAAASPRGGAFGLWSTRDGRWLGGLAIPDVCGVTAGADGFWVSSGLGEIVKIAANASGPSIEARWHADAGFDNHLLMI
jgi:hypothetical protein